MSDEPERTEPKTPPRKNSRYLAFNLKNEQAARYEKLAKEAGENKNSLMRLIAEKMKLSDVRTLQNRR